MKPGDRLITALVGTHHTGDVFKEWLLHVTIVAWFASDLSSETIAQNLSDSLHGIQPFTVTMGSEAYIGYGGKALVNVVAQPTPFMEIQRRVEQTLDDLGVTMTATRGTWGEAYRPHVTVQAGQRLHKGDSWKCSGLYVVSLRPDGTNVIEAEIPLV